MSGTAKQEVFRIYLTFHLIRLSNFKHFDLKTQSIAFRGQESFPLCAKTFLIKLESLLRVYDE